AVLASLLVAGRLSDHIGRRPVLVASTLAQVVARGVLSMADGVCGLLAGRVIQGLATGAAVAAVGAGLLDIDRARGAIANAIAPISGTALGGLLGGLMVHFLPAPAHLVYLALALVFLLQCLGLLRMSESLSRLPGALASLRPQFAVPPAVRASMLLAVPVLVAAWAVGGFYASLNPALLHRIFGFDASLVGGVALFLLAASGAAAVLLLQRSAPRAMMRFGAASLIGGMVVVLLSLWLRMAPIYFLGTVVAGMGFGTGFQGAIRSVMPLAAAHERAGVLSVLFAVSYLSMGLLAVMAGSLVAAGNPLLATAQEFALMVMLLAALALAGMRLQR
ncbi:MAG TPA: MFS transporter, partial [Variovorax sp.]